MSKDKSNCWYYNTRGHSYLLRGRYDDALADFREAAKLDPNYPYAKRNIKIAAEQIGTKGLMGRGKKEREGNDLEGIRFLLETDY